MGREVKHKVRAKRHTPEQVIRQLREAEVVLDEGKTIPEVAKALEVSENTFHRWRKQYGGLKADDAKRLKELETENRQLKQLVADKDLRRAQALGLD
jgi:transposase-like protein